LGRLFLKKFMAVTHFAYSVLKVPGPHGPMTIHGDRKGVVACDMKTLDMIRQYIQVPLDPKEPPAKQHKTTAVATMTPATPKPKETPKDPESSKAARRELRLQHHQLKNRQPLPVKATKKMLSWQRLLILLLK
jgi:hypothetical protein